MNMFNKVAHTADNIKSVIKDPKGKTAPDKMEKETLPSLLHDRSESEEETPMKPPAISSDAPDPNDDWDTYTEDATTMVQEKRGNNVRWTAQRNETKQNRLQMQMRAGRT
jgi:rubrerythrin